MLFSGAGDIAMCDRNSLATGALLQASVPNEGEGLDRYRQGSPVTVRIPADALRVLSGA